MNKLRFMVKDILSALVNMIYSKRLGSLGNQMHIVATTYAVALDNKTDWAVSHQTNEGYRGLIERSSFNDTFFRGVPKKNINSGKNFSEGDFTYKRIPNEKNLNLRGYFQSEKYYGHRKSEIYELFHNYYPEVENIVQTWFKDCDKLKTISMHIRRTDYVKLSNVHVVQPIDYYQAALENIAGQLGIDFDTMLNEYTLLVFSDDLSWCREQDFFKSKRNVRYVENNLGRDMDAIVDLYVMSQCHHNIIANSSFSWWASYLNKNEDKIVVAPKRWFGPKGPKNWQDVYFQGMTII